MKQYRAYFTFYSELYGNFDETYFKIEAENQFEARRKAWAICEDNEEMKFTSNLRLIGITWIASPLDLQDYFNSEVAHEKCRLRFIESVDIPNANIEKTGESDEYITHQKYERNGCLDAVYRISCDFGRPLGMLPPTIYEELHYAREFLTLLEGCEDFERYNAFLKLIERAEKWESAAMYDIRDGFKYGYFNIGEEQFDFSAQFGKNGLYPTRADLKDSEHPYIRRWSNAREHKTLSRLPFFGEKDIITGSDALQYGWQALVLKMDALEPEHQIPMNIVWTANQDSEANYDTCGDGIIAAENMITGEIREWKRSDFLGILRPEISSKIDCVALSREYQAIKSESVVSETQNNKPEEIPFIEPYYCIDECEDEIEP